MDEAFMPPKGIFSSVYAMCSWLAGKGESAAVGTRLRVRGQDRRGHWHEAVFIRKVGGGWRPAQAHELGTVSSEGALTPTMRRKLANAEWAAKRSADRAAGREAAEREVKEAGAKDAFAGLLGEPEEGR